MKIDWCHVPAGDVIVGTPPEQLDAVWRDLSDLGVERTWLVKETPRHVLRVEEFWIARTPVTVADWLEFGRDAPEPADRGDLPVSGVAWADAVAFCAWASERTGLTLRLPTEPEWERAARSDDAREFPWGDTFDPARANLHEHGADGPLPVGSLPLGASPFGVLDLAGNVDEWTATEYAPYPGAPAEVPAREAWAFDPHITRGGAWFHGRDLARCARRHGAYEPGYRGVGFRLATSQGRSSSRSRGSDRSFGRRPRLSA